MSIQNHPLPSAPVFASGEAQASRMIHYLGGYRLLRLPRRNVQHLEVLDGSAWVTVDGEDIILNAGDHYDLLEGHDFALVSSVQQKRLVLAVNA